MIEKETKSTCCYCGVGCGVLIRSRDGKIESVRGDPDHPANFGRLCTKGANLHLTAGLDGRLLYPQMRRERHEVLRKASWDEALDHAAEKFATLIGEYGPDSVAFYISGQLLTEDYYVFNKLAKGLVGTNNVDTNSRLCMSSAVAGYKATLGMDAPPCCYEDIDHADCLFIAGSNTAYAHPVLFRRIEEARRKNPAMRLIVVDPRRTDTAQCADLHLPILPGTDVMLFHAMLHVLIWEGLCDTSFIGDHTEGFDSLKEAVRSYTPEFAAEVCGIFAEDIVKAAKWFGESGSTLSLYCQGLNQSACGTDKNAALINLHLAAGKIGKPGSGPFSLTGQHNAMGGREVGGMANLLSAHRDLANAGHRAEVAKIWGVEEVPAKPGKTAVEMFDAVRRGEIRAIWIACTNPAQSMPDLNAVREALEKAELVVLQEAYGGTDTAIFADILLPAASWGEKEGCVTNSERRISHVRPAVDPPAEARPDWEIAVDFARRLAARLGKKGNLFPYESVEEVFNEHRETTRGRDLDITGLSYAVLDEEGPKQWPYPEGSETKVRLYGDGIFPTASRRARFHHSSYSPVAEIPDVDYPFRLNTGRLRDQWHGMSRTGKVAKLCNHAEEPILSMNRGDLARHGLKDGDLVRVKSRRGEIVVKIGESEEMRPMQVFMPMHWGSRFMNSMGSNALTSGVSDPVSRQPELKACAVRIEKMSFNWRMIAMARGKAVQKMEEMASLLPLFSHASCGLSGREEPVLILRVSNENALNDETIESIDRILGLDDDSMAMTYLDAKKGISKKVLMKNDQVIGVRLTGEVAAEGWLKEIMVAGTNAEKVRPWVLAPVSSPPRGIIQRGRIICNCFDVSESQIRAVVAEGADFALLQKKLQCGTKCGSCIPELKRFFN